MTNQPTPPDQSESLELLADRLVDVSDVWDADAIKMKEGFRTLLATARASAKEEEIRILAKLIPSCPSIVELQEFLEGRLASLTGKEKE